LIDSNTNSAEISGVEQVGVRLRQRKCPATPDTSAAKEKLQIQSVRIHGSKRQALKQTCSVCLRAF
jgi:hypothetical protein